MAKNNSIKISNVELVFQNHEKDKRETDLNIANHELKKLQDYQIKCLKVLEEMMLITQKLRHPITQIVGLSILLTDSRLNENEQKEMIDMIQKSAQSLDNFSRELTIFTQRKKPE